MLTQKLLVEGHHLKTDRLVIKHLQSIITDTPNLKSIMTCTSNVQSIMADLYHPDMIVNYIIIDQVIK
jgi:hypothetical protein